jgi:ADP-ribose pyrophosphatase
MTKSITKPTTTTTATVVGFEIESDQIVAREGGFLAIRRLRMRNRRDDGTLSEQYLCDFIDRPIGLDAVVVALYCRSGGSVQVLVRDGLRPPVALGRPAERTPVPEPTPHIFLTELVAGIVEEDDRGLEGIRRRAAAEALEEAGYRIDPDSVVLLGQAPFPSPGAMSERFWLVAAEIADPAAREPIEGDGSPMEEGATIRWIELDQAIAACVRGDIEDMKTELTLRRLRDALAG